MLRNLFLCLLLLIISLLSFAQSGKKPIMIGPGPLPKSPIILIDSVFVENNNLAISDPNIIGRISVLKDSLDVQVFAEEYGNDAYNGVIIITTKLALYRTFLESRRNENGFVSISNLLSDSITIKDLDANVAIYSKEEFEVIYQWDSVFQPRYELSEIGYTDTTLELIQSETSLRYAFLSNNPLVMKKCIRFDGAKITAIDNYEYVDVDWDKWTRKRDKLVKWIDKKYPELSGFIYDMTPQGAADYLRAIELYEGEK